MFTMRYRKQTSPEGNTSRDIHLKRILFTSLLIISSLVVPCLEAQEHTSGTTINNFFPIGDYVLEIGGNPAPETEFYLAEKIPAIMVQNGTLPDPVLLLPLSGTVQTVQNSVLTSQADGSIDLQGDTVKEQGKFQILASWIVFSIDGQEMTLKQRPWLLAVHDAEDMLNHNPEYVWRFKGYTPNKEIIEELKNQPVETKVRVYFGSWCNHCKKQIPLMIKVASELAGSHIHIDYYGLPQGFGRHPVAGPLKIKAVPTGIVYVDGREIGRVTGDQWKSPESSLKEILVR